jgi:hypothetical protein
MFCDDVEAEGRKTDPEIFWRQNQKLEALKY